MSIIRKMSEIMFPGNGKIDPVMHMPIHCSFTKSGTITYSPITTSNTITRIIEMIRELDALEELIGLERNYKRILNTYDKENLKKVLSEVNQALAVIKERKLDMDYVQHLQDLNRLNQRFKKLKRKIKMDLLQQWLKAVRSKLQCIRVKSYLLKQKQRASDLLKMPQVSCIMQIISTIAALAALFKGSKNRLILSN